ncbi:MAG TPA: tetratricopeptide repeat protein [Polyangiales bacterium]|nr:tetratricopeptide repeat protein [Polyangiales bacterium]
MRNNTFRAAVLALTASFSFAAGCGSKNKEESTTSVDDEQEESSGGSKSGGGSSSVKSGGSGSTGAVSKQAEADWKEALAAFEGAEKSGWDSSKCESISGQFASANKAQKGKFAEAIYMSGLALDRCGKSEQAIKAYNSAIEINGKLCGARVGLGIQDFKKGNEAGAYANFERAVRDDARCTEGYVNLAMMQMARSGAKSEDALNNLRRALAIDATYLPAFNQMAALFVGRAEGNAKMLDLAAVVCRQAQLINPNYAPIYNTWGLINVKKQNVFDALRMFERASQLDGSNFEAHMNFGQITLSFRGYEDAKKAFAKAVELKPKDYDAHVGLGAALRGLGDAEGAKKQYEEAKGIEASRPEAYFNLGILYQDYMSGSVPDMKQAVSYYDQFVQRASGKTEYKSTVDDIERKCDSSEAKKKRKSSKSCRPGRRQNIQLAIEAMAAMAEMEKMQKQSESANPQ